MGRWQFLRRRLYRWTILRLRYDCYIVLLFILIGRYYFADLDKWYEGEFRRSSMEGRGIETWSDGRKYEGDFKNGKKDGEGTFEWPNASKYIGSWRDDK